MAKCVICNQRKGKRSCLVTQGFICSICCGAQMDGYECADCSFYKASNAIHEKRAIFSSGKTLTLEDTIGTGLPALLAKVLHLTEKTELPPKGQRETLDRSVLDDIYKCLLDKNITVHPRPDGSIDVKTTNGVIKITE